MRILIIEDDQAKLDDVKDCLQKLDAHVKIDNCDNLSKAVQLVTSNRYNLIILDLMIPYIQGLSADRRGGLEALRVIRRDECINRHTSVIGLSGYPAELASARDEFEDAGVLIKSYEKDASNWRETLSQSYALAKANEKGLIDLDFIIFVALQKEKSGYQESALEFGEVCVVAGLNVQEVKLRGEKESRGVIIKLREMGLIASSHDVTVALSIYNARVVCMSGICAGFQEHTSLGQIVIGSPVWEYQAGKWADNQFEIAPRQIQLRPKTKLAIEQALEDRGWENYIESNLPKGCFRPNMTSKALVCPGASGSAVIADKSRLDHIVIQHRKIAFLEMEAFGLYYSAFESSRHVEHFFVAKTVVDFADDAKGDQFHHYGCIVSARAALKIISVLISGRA